MVASSSKAKEKAERLTSAWRMASLRGWPFSLPWLSLIPIPFPIVSLVIKLQAILLAIKKSFINVKK